MANLLKNKMKTQKVCMQWLPWFLYSLRSLTHVILYVGNNILTVCMDSQSVPILSNLWNTLHSKVTY